MGEAKRRKLIGASEPRAFDVNKLAGRSLSSVFAEYGPKPGHGWKWTSVVGHGNEAVYIFVHPEHPGIERIIGGTIALEFYRPTSDADPFDPGQDRYHTLAEAIAALT